MRKEEGSAAHIYTSRKRLLEGSPMHAPFFYFIFMLHVYDSKFARVKFSYLQQTASQKAPYIRGLKHGIDDTPRLEAAVPDSFGLA